MFFLWFLVTQNDVEKRWALTSPAIFPRARSWWCSTRRNCRNSVAWLSAFWGMAILPGLVMTNIYWDLMVICGDLMVIYWDLMVIYGDLMVIYGDL